MYVNCVLSVIGRKWSGGRWPQWPASCCPWLGVSGFLQGLGSGRSGGRRSPWPVSCYPWLGCSWFLQGLVNGKWQNTWLVMVFTGSCQWQVAKTQGFHGICRVLSVASCQNPWFSWHLQGLVSGKWPKPTKTHGFHGIYVFLSVASGQNPRFSRYFQGLVSGSGPSHLGKVRLAPGLDCNFSK